MPIHVNVNTLQHHSKCFSQDRRTFAGDFGFHVLVHLVHASIDERSETEIGAIPLCSPIKRQRAQDSASTDDDSNELVNKASCDPTVASAVYLQSNTRGKTYAAPMFTR